MRETLADASIHVLGLLLALGAGVILLIHVAQTEGPTQIAATSIYAGFLFFSFVASALYHLLPGETLRPLFRRIDHAAIYFKIAGTYTPLVVLIGSAFAYVVLAGVWLVALIGAVAKLSFWAADARGSLPVYLGMGWASLLLIWPMTQTLPSVAVGLIIGGGVLYSLGTLVYRYPQMRYQNAVWHGVVLAASTCFFAAVSVSVSA
ncbi:hemolysin III family protein [uncultured Tateyamaria sp.]|uniref:PAQR family membrane homeostasis protein TrhA n=1 Tax=uncultured Tateyamaria sp. TaxID=455651 RepID=UPI0026269D37|nr:hemolysin III family protein [uncultured Tateyamaria sp.]